MRRIVILLVLALVLNGCISQHQLRSTANRAFRDAVIASVIVVAVASVAQYAIAKSVERRADPAPKTEPAAVPAHADESIENRWAQAKRDRGR